MLGMVFTEFLELVEERYSPELADAILQDAAPPNGGAYTAVGYYDHGEMVSLLMALSQRTGAPVPELLKAFGEHLFGRFLVAYPGLFQDRRDAFELLESIDNYIHVEVRKLYPDARLPSFTVEERTPGRLVLGYRSPRGLADLAEGLIRGAIAHYGQPLSLTREDRPNEGDVHCSVFTLSSS